MPELISGGWKIVYRVEGNPSAPTLLMVPGASHRMTHWATLPGLLAPHLRLVLFDPRGFGESERKEEPYTVADVMGDFTALLDAANAPKAFVMGQALGGMFAQEFALACPERVLGLIVTATSHRGPSSFPVAPHTAEQLKAIKPGLSREEVYVIQNDACSHPGWREEDPEGFESLLRLDVDDPPRRASIQAAGKALEGWEAETRLANLRVPALVIHGELDGMVPLENGRQIASLAPDSELEVMHGVGHMPVHEAPEKFAAIIVDWIKRHTP